MPKIKSITPAGKEDVYNMEVENHHNYSVCGGFILHNCDALRYYAAARIFPSGEAEDGNDEFGTDRFGGFLYYGTR